MEVLPYTPQDFNTRIPHYEDAFERFDTVEGKALVDSDIHDLFLAHKMEKTFGITIAHRHFVLNNNEHLVAYGNTSTPWSDVAKDDSTIKAVTWFITPGGAVQPYEFEFTISEKEVLDPNSPEQTKFVQELAKLLKEKKVEGLFGLVKYPGDDFKGCLETTQGRANICFVKGEVSHIFWFQIFED
jgi:hypothetical protein